MTTVEERTAFAKLEALKEIRYVSYSFPYKNIDFVNIIKRMTFTKLKHKLILI